MTHISDEMKKIFEFYKKTMVCKNMVKYDILCYFDEIKIFENGVIKAGVNGAGVKLGPAL